jgi:nitrite reductase/ring-hydroxylating ferredoxin subunit
MNVRCNQLRSNRLRFSIFPKARLQERVYKSDIPTADELRCGAADRGSGGSLMADDTETVVRVCSALDVAPGAVKAFAVGATMLAVYNIDGRFYVTDDECTHAAASLADGMLDGDVIECCMHMGSFHVPTGDVVAPPCEVPLRTYQVVLNGDDVFADLARNAAGEPQ